MKQQTTTSNQTNHHQKGLSDEKEEERDVSLNKKSKTKKKANIQPQPQTQPQPQPQSQSQNGSSSTNGNNSNNDESGRDEREQQENRPSNDNKKPLVDGATSSQKRRQRRKRELERQNQLVSNDVKAQDEWNPLQETQDKFLQSIPISVRENFFNDNVVSPEIRAKWWELQSDIGIECINQYAWATPHISLLKIFEEFSPLIEIGCGKNAYWANWMIRNSSKQIKIVAYDVNPNQGGQIIVDQDDETTKSNKNKKRKKNKNDSSSSQVKVLKGGPEVLSQSKYKDYTLFLCYPDEQDKQEEDDSPPKSMGYQCLEEFQGSYIIHVGELYGHNTCSLDSQQHPWGRSSSVEFQICLNKKFHCLLQIKLPNQWLHSSDTLTIWKRSSQICEMIFEQESGNDENESGEEDDVIQYKHVPFEEQLPLTMAAPCLQHLLPKNNDLTTLSPASSSRITSINQKRECENDDDDDNHDDHSNHVDHEGPKVSTSINTTTIQQDTTAKKGNKKRKKLQEINNKTSTKNNGTTKESNNVSKSNEANSDKDKKDEEESNDDDDDSDDNEDSDSDDSMIGPKW